MDSDDRWLEYRISKNILEYGLYYWNPYELINISTPVIWNYIASSAHILSHVFNISWESSIKILGLSIYTGTAICIYRIDFQNNYIKVFIFIGVVAYFPLAYWSISGLESGLCAFWLLFIFNRFYSTGPSGLNWLFYCLIIFIRPEFIIAPLISMVANLVSEFRKKAYVDLLSPFLIFLSVSLAWLLFNKLIWNDWFPTPFYLKSIFHSPFLAGFTWSFKSYNALIHFLSSVFQSIFLCISLLIIIAVCFKYIFTKGYRLQIKDSEKTIIHLTIGLSCVAGYHIISGYQHMSYVFRYFVPENIGFIFLSGLLLRESMFSSLRLDTNRLRTYLFAATLIQLIIFISTAFYVNKVELSLTRAKHRDAFSGDAYSALMKDWHKVGEKLKSIELPNDRLWAKDGTNLAGAAVTNMYALDGYYSPLWRSMFKSIRECKDWECANYFNYVMLRKDDESWKKALSRDRFVVLFEGEGILVLKNNLPEK